MTRAEGTSYASLAGARGRRRMILGARARQTAKDYWVLSPDLSFHLQLSLTFFLLDMVFLLLLLFLSWRLLVWRNYKKSRNWYVFLLLACKQYWNLDEVYMLFWLCLYYFFFFSSWRLLVWRNFCKPRIWHVSLLECKHLNLEKTDYFLLRLCFFFFSSWWLLVWRNCMCRFGLHASLLSCKHWS